MVGTQPWPKPARQRVAEAVAAGLGQRAAARGQHHRRGAVSVRPSVALDDEASPRGAHASDARAGCSIVTPRRRASRAAPRARSAPVGIGKELAVLLLVQRARPAPRRTRRRAPPETRAARARRAAATPPQKSRSVTTRFVTLQREPPLTRIFAPMWPRAVQAHASRSAGAARAAKIAVASPAAPRTDHDVPRRRSSLGPRARGRHQPTCPAVVVAASDAARAMDGVHVTRQPRYVVMRQRAARSHVPASPGVPEP